MKTGSIISSRRRESMEHGQLSSHTQYASAKHGPPPGLALTGSGSLILLGNQINFMKNVAPLGAALAMAAIPQPWPRSIGGSAHPLSSQETLCQGCLRTSPGCALVLSAATYKALAASALSGSSRSTSRSSTIPFCHRPSRQSARA